MAKSSACGIISREGNVREISQCASLMQPVGSGDNYGQVSPFNIVAMPASDVSSV